LNSALNDTNFNKATFAVKRIRNYSVIEKDRQMLELTVAKLQHKLFVAKESQQKSYRVAKK